jgi:hypothetical protein
MRIVRVTEIITPGERGVFRCEHGEFVAVEDPVAVFPRAVAAADQLFMLPLELLEFFLEGYFVHEHRVVGG